MAPGGFWPRNPVFLRSMGTPRFLLAACLIRGRWRMIQFELAEPTTLAQAVQLLDPDDETIRPIAGGTALMLIMKAGVFRPAKLVSLRNIESTHRVIKADAGGLTIG